MSRKKRPLFDPELIRPDFWSAICELHPRDQVRNPVMFVVYLGALFTLLLFAQAIMGQGDASPGFILSISLWLWATLLFADFAEATPENKLTLIREYQAKGHMAATAATLSAISARGTGRRSSSSRRVSKKATRCGRSMPGPTTSSRSPSAPPNSSLAYAPRCAGSSP